MNTTVLLFWVFATVLVYSAVRVVTARNPVVGVLHLVLAFFNAAGIWLLLQAEFLAIVLVLVYVGAVMVLFLFVVMMLDINLDRLREGFWKNLPAAMVVGVVIVVEMGLVLVRQFAVQESAAPAVAAQVSNTKLLGALLYTDYVFGFELAAALLLVAMVAAVMLTLRGRKDVRTQRPSEQVKVSASDRLRLVRMFRNMTIRIARPIADSAAATVRMKKTKTWPAISPR